MGVKRPDVAQAVKEGRSVDEAKPKSLAGDGETAKPRGRAAVYQSPIKEWSGGMWPEEVAVWEAIADKCREGVRPMTAVEAVGKLSTYKQLRKARHPVVTMLAQAWAEGRTALLATIRGAQTWQAAAWLLERQDPMEYAVDGSIRRTIIEWAQEAGLDVSTLNDVVRIVKRCQELEIDLGDLVEDEIKRREAELA